MKQLCDVSAKQTKEIASLKDDITSVKKDVNQLITTVGKWGDSMQAFSEDFSRFIEEWESTGPSEDEDDCDRDRDRGRDRDWGARDREGHNLRSTTRRDKPKGSTYISNSRRGR